MRGSTSTVDAENDCFHLPLRTLIQSAFAFGAASCPLKEEAQARIPLENRAGFRIATQARCAECRQAVDVLDVDIRALVDEQLAHVCGASGGRRHFPRWGSNAGLVS